MSPDAYLEMARTEACHWWFVGRRAILTRLIGGIGLCPGARILEIGCGTGGNLQMLAAFGAVSAIEMDATARSIASERMGGVCDIRAGMCPSDIPFVGEKFDLICLLDVLEHIDEDVETLCALRSFLARGGRILLTVPAHRWLWSAHDERLHHKRRYAVAALRQTIRASGLDAIRVSYFNTLLFPLVVASRVKDRLTGKASARGTGVPLGPVNRALTSLFAAERCLLGSVNLPFGVSLLAVLRAEPS